MVVTNRLTATSQDQESWELQSSVWRAAAPDPLWIDYFLSGALSLPDHVVVVSPIGSSVGPPASFVGLRGLFILFGISDILPVRQAYKCCWCCWLIDYTLSSKGSEIILIQATQLSSDTQSHKMPIENIAIL